jgi:four helix bundle protein
MRLVLAVYDATAKFPQEELFGLKNQLRRAAVSIPSSIAEGQARYSHKEFQHFVANARGSLAEIETQVLLARELGYVPRDPAAKLLDLCAELGRILNGLRLSLRQKEN